jgi:acetoin utilization deacetylase AcuC-like enzyme
MRNCPVFYRPEMSATTESFSTSSSKPKRTVQAWLASGAITKDDIQLFPAASVEDLYSAHSADYVDGVLRGDLPNGFGNCDEGIAKSLRFTTGSMVEAALYVARHGGFACSPTSGFHHAHFERGGGFCTFNGLMVAAIELDRMGKTVGILDCDAHYGDGTQNIIDTLGLSRIRHHAFGKLHPPGRRYHNTETFKWLDSALHDMRKCDVVLYQAGADPFEDDPLGGQMSLKELAVRDSMVFSTLKNVAWNLAGGYCLATPHIHNNTLLAAQGRLG